MKLRSFRGKTKSLALDALDVKKIGDEYHFEGYANKPVIDRYHEIVDVKAFEGSLETYARNPILLLQHNPYWPVGTLPHLELRPDGLYVKGKIGHGWQIADDTRMQVEQGILRAMSIGFRETARGVVDKDGIYHITGLELLEVSLVSIPANQEALFQMDETGKLLKVELLDDEEAKLTDSELMLRRNFAMSDDHLIELCERRGLRLRAPVAYVKYPTQDPNTPWDAGKARESLKAYATNGEDVDYLRYRMGFTYVVPGEEGKLSGYKLPHHLAADDTVQTNLRGCRAVIGVLAGARGGVKLPEDARRDVYSHIARHIVEDFGVDVPSFEDLGKMADDELLAKLEITAEDITSVLAEYELSNKDSDDPPPAELPVVGLAARPLTEDPAWQELSARLGKASSELESILETVTALRTDVDDLKTVVQSPETFEKRLRDVERACWNQAKIELRRLTLNRTNDSSTPPLAA